MELAPNTRFGPYEIVEQIGAGGMGIVYKAMDTRLQRSVALKFLRPHLVPNADAKRRFMREAQAASALEHNNICTIYEVDETPDGQMYLAMRFYEGETLADRIARGAMPAGEAIAIASQVASGLARAHAAGIVHRDIKPANLLLCTDGTVKILDFGLTKHVNETRYTQHGAVLGTVAYMSPEQARGDAVDARSDVWALGVILYEMLTGQLPFRGGNDAAVLNAIASADAGHPSAENVAVPPALDAIVTKALAKDPSKRYPTASELLKELERLAAPAPQSVAQLKPWKRGVFGLAAALIVGAVAVWFWNYRDEQLQGQVERLILAIESAIDEDANLEAFELAEQLEAMDPDNPLLPNYWPRFSVTVAITSEPPGAEVSYRPYEKTDAAWITLGPTGLSARLPRDDLRIRFEKDGYVAEERAVWLAVLNTGRFDSMDVALAEVGTEPDGMIRIPAGRYGAQLIGIDVDSYELDEFFIDRYEVSNEDYFEFMEAGGYEDPEYWAELIRDLGPGEDWQAYVAEHFITQSGELGPFTWEDDILPGGREDHPVTGISWYEAAAFASWKGRRLPTLYHWAAASGTPMAYAILPLSNFSGADTSPVGKFAGVGPYGTFDMAGNAREWIYNEKVSSEGRIVLGGAYSDVDHLFVQAETRSASDRDPGSGFRTVYYPESDAAAWLEQEIPEGYRRSLELNPPSDAVYAAYASEFESDFPSLNASREWESLPSPIEGAELRRVTFTSADPSSTMQAYLFLPSGVERPFQTIVYVEGAVAANRSSSALRIGSMPETFLPLRRWVQTGRAVVVPVISGTYERGDGNREVTPTTDYTNWYRAQVDDIRQTVNFLYAYPDVFDAEKIAYAGFSWGAPRGILALALDDRFKTAIMLDGAIIHAPYAQAIDPLNFAYRVTQPVLLLNGTNDLLEPIELQDLQFEALGGSEAGNERRTWEAPHGIVRFFPAGVSAATIDWLDQQFGRVD